MIALFLCLITIASAQENLGTIYVKEAPIETISDSWEENSDVQIFSGKKNTKTSLKKIPQLQTNTYRQAISQTPGLLISEVPNEAIASLNFRGLGDPHESFNILLLQDGIPVSADMYGYPAHYFSPALPMMDEVHFIRGGASLHYGPQPGGSLNYLSTPLYKGIENQGEFGLTGGSYNLLTTNNSYKGSSKSNAYSFEYYRRQGDGLQRTNADFYADYLQARNIYFFENGSKLKLALNGYNSEHGNPGGFSKTSGAGLNEFGKDPKKATRDNDRLQVSRLLLSSTYEKKINDKLNSEIDVWGSLYRRYSTNQNGGGFGSFPTLDSTNIVSHHYYTYAAKAKLLQNWQDHTLSLGYQFYNVISPYTTELGDSAESKHGEVRKRVNRETHSHSLFLENRFVFNNLYITPGVRVESINQKINERKNLDTTNPDLRRDNRTDNVTLFGLGMSYHTNDYSQLYLNISEAYKPISFQDAVPLNSGDAISDDIDPSKILNSEIGYRGKNTHLSWDTSLFYTRYENRFGRVANVISNTGAATHQGVDLSLEMSLLKYLSNIETVKNINLYLNTSLLDAHFSNGSLKDKKPMYAPRKVSRAGLIYRKENKTKIALMGVFVDKHFADDGNSSDYEIPYYMVWDLTCDYEFNQSWKMSTGINNLLDRDYTSRIRSDGIYQALGRNYYLGLTYSI